MKPITLQAFFFGFTIGVGVTNSVILGSPPPFGFGLSPDTVSGLYATPLVSHFLYRIRSLTSLTLTVDWYSYRPSDRPLLKRLDHEGFYTAKQRCFRG